MRSHDNKIGVLVIDDSATTRKILVRVLESDPDLEVVGQAADGNRAVELAHELRPDLITMDVLMPQMDGLEATRRIMAALNIPILMVTALNDLDSHGIAFEALAAGALNIIGKPEGNNDIWRKAFLGKVKALAQLAGHGGVEP